jgi:hypothetical protein
MVLDVGVCEKKRRHPDVMFVEYEIMDVTECRPSNILIICILVIFSSLFIHN